MKISVAVSALLALAIFNAHAFSLEAEKIYFSEGRPGLSETYPDMESVVDQQVLSRLLKALQEHPSIGVDVTGFADEHESEPIDCRNLSLRRAKLVFDWLLDHGFSLTRLRGPLGESIDWPIGRTEDERHFNRRVQLELHIVSGEEPSEVGNADPAKKMTRNNDYSTSKRFFRRIGKKLKLG